MLFWQIVGHFWCSVVTLVSFKSKLNNFEKIYKNPKIQKIQNSPKFPFFYLKTSLKNPELIQKMSKLSKISKNELVKI